MKRFFLVSMTVLVLGQPNPRASWDDRRNCGVAECAAADAAQQPAYHSTTLLVALQVTVLHGSKLVTGLGAGDFAVFEDGVQQQLQFFDARKVGLDLTLLLDASSSMAGRFQPVNETAVAFMKNLRAGDRGSVVAFNEGFNVVQPLTDDHERIAGAIRSVRPSGSTSLRNALYIALREVAAARPNPDEIRREAIVALSDGIDTASLVPFEDVLTLAENSGVNLYIVTLQPPPGAEPSAGTDPTAVFDLRKLARSTGAEAFFLNDLTGLKATLDGISRELITKYSLAYVPTDTAGDERFRHIDVRVTSNPAYRARARTGYVASPGLMARTR